MITSKPNWREAAGQINLSGYDPTIHRWVTQIGGRTFKEEPRWKRELSLSVITGRVSTKDAVRAAFRRPDRPTDQVRFFRIADLVGANYFPHPDPHVHHPDHGCIRAPIVEDTVALHRAWWANPLRVTLISIARS